MKLVTIFVFLSIVNAAGVFEGITKFAARMTTFAKPKAIKAHVEPVMKAAKAWKPNFKKNHAQIIQKKKNMKLNGGKNISIFNARNRKRDMAKK